MIKNPTHQNIPSGWKQVILGKVASITNGSTNTQDAIAGGEYPLFDRSVEIKKSNKYLFDDTAIILPGEGAEFVPRIYSGKFDLHQRAYAIFPDKNIVIPAYLYHFLYANRKTFVQKSVGSTVKSLRLPLIQSVDVNIPPIKEQQKIAEILGTVDEDITKTQEVITATEKLKRGLMQQLFTRGIGHTKFKETKIGQIPEEWEVQKLEKFIKSLDAGVSVNSRDVQKEEGEIGILKTSAVTFGVFDPKQHKTVVSEEVARVAIPVKADRLIVSRMNTRDLVGANAYTNESFSDLFLPDRLWQVEPKNEENISMHWLSYIFNLQWKNGIFSSMATGTSASMKNLSKGSILNMELAFPKVEEQKEIAEILAAVDEKILVNKKLKAKLTLLKKGLMQDLLSGAVRAIIN